MKNNLADAYPNAHIGAFAVIRTISNPSQFHGVYAHCMGTIEKVGNQTFRWP